MLNYFMHRTTATSTSCLQMQTADNMHIFDRTMSLQHMAPLPRFDLPSTTTRQVLLPTVGEHEPVYIEPIRSRPDVVPSVDVSTVMRGLPPVAGQYTFPPMHVKPTGYASLTPSTYLLGKAPVGSGTASIPLHHPMMFGNSARVAK
jgi:hypothetical protein